MKKELLMIIVLLGLPTLFIMGYGDAQSTGAATTEMASLRIERINLMLNFPQTTDVYKTITYRVREYLRRGSHADYYYHNRLGAGDAFFLNEINLLPELFKLMCLAPTEFTSKGRFISPGGIPIHIAGGNRWFTGQIQDIGQVPCNPDLANRAEEVLIKVMEIDFKMVELTIQTSNCPYLADESMKRAYDNLAEGAYEAVITNLRNAGSRAISCA